MFEILLEEPRNPIERWASNLWRGFTFNGSQINFWLAGLLLVLIEVENLHQLWIVHSSLASFAITLWKFLAAAVPYAIILLLLRRLASLANHGRLNAEAAAEVSSWMRSLLFVIYLSLL